MIEARGLTKRFGRTMAVDDLSFVVRPGHVTGFLGPNGAGKSTTMRLMLDLDLPTTGSVTVAGRRYRELTRPLFQVGALLDASALHPGRTARAHLQTIAASNGIANRRVEEVLELVGLASAARRRGRALSLGMRQRLGIAAALLGDPAVLLFDEPINGLDPEGIRWARELLKALAGEGRTVLVSSHLMSEMAITADRLLVIGRGRLIADSGIEEFVASATQASVVVQSPEAARLAGVVASAGAVVDELADSRLVMHGLDAPRVGDLAFGAGIVLHELATVRPSLEEAYLELTGEAVEFRSGTLPQATSEPAGSR